MKRALGTLQVFTVLGILLTASLASAQESRVKALVGKWEGTVEWATTGENAAYGGPDRTLIVESVVPPDSRPER